MKRFLPVLVLLSFANMGYASGFMLSGVGPRGLSMAGGGYRATVAGWDAVFWNPAGLAGTAPTSVELYISVVNPKASYEPNTGILGYDGPYSMRYKVNAKEQLFTIPAFGVYHGGGQGFIDGYGFSFFAPFGLGAAYDLYDPPIGYYITSDTSFYQPEFPKHDWVSDLKITAAWFGVGKQLSDKLSVGLSGGPVFASLYFRRVDFVDPAVSDSMAVSLPIQYRLWPLDVQLSGSGMGFGVGIGAQFKASERLKVGVSGRFYSSIKLDGQDSVVLYLPKNDAIASRDTALAFIFSGATIPSFSNGSTTLPLPWTVGADVAYRVSPKLTVGFGVEVNGHGVLQDVPVNFDSLVIMNERIYAETLRFYWKNTVKLSLGGSYRLGDAELRAGAYYEASPIPDSTFTPLIPDTGDKLSLNFGFTVPMGQHVAVSGNVEAMVLASREVKRAVDYSYRSSNMPGKYASSVTAAGLGLSYKF